MAGYAEPTLKNAGGWHFVNWLYTTKDSAVEHRDGDRWQAVFNSDAGVEVLELLRGMRFTDRSLGGDQLHDADSVLQVISSAQVFTEPFALTGGGPGNATTSVLMLVYRYAFRDASFGKASALGLILFVVLGACSLWYVRLARRVTGD